MGLTHRSVGTHAAAFGGTRRAGERIVALAGNPNVGKSTVFNALTGMRQHTGNWAGKTVGCACGRCRSAREQYLLVDLPGTYSLQPHSAEEAVACDFVRGGKADAVVVVCDATCLERTLVLNAQHPLVKNLAGRPQDDTAKDICLQLTDLAEMAQQPLPAERMNAFLTRTMRLMTELATEEKPAAEPQEAPAEAAPADEATETANE